MSQEWQKQYYFTQKLSKEFQDYGKLTKYDCDLIENWFENNERRKANE